MATFIGLLLVVMGVAIAAMWTHDIVGGTQFDASVGRLRARSDGGDLLLPHWIAEYATAVALVIGGGALLLDAPFAAVVASAAAGALAYTSVTSLGWALAQQDRVAYAIPMTAGIIVASAAIAYLITT
jgi:hypothetical protein